MIPGFQGLPQNPSNQRPTMALLSCSRDMTDPLSAIKGQVHSEQVHLGFPGNCFVTRVAQQEGGYSRDLAFIAPCKVRVCRGRSATLIAQRFSGGISRIRRANSAT